MAMLPLFNVAIKNVAAIMSNPWMPYLSQYEYVFQSKVYNIVPNPWLA